MQFKANYVAGVNCVSNFENGNLQLMTGPDGAGVEHKIVDGYHVADWTTLYASDTVVEFCIPKTNAGFAASDSINDMCFFVGKWGTWSMDGVGLVAGEYAPAENGYTTIINYVKYDTTVVNRCSATTGGLSLDSYTIGYADATDLATKTLAISLYDYDNNNSTASVTIESETNGVVFNSTTSSLTKGALMFEGTVAAVAATVAGTYGANEVPVVDGVVTIVRVIYNDASTSAVVEVEATFVQGKMVTISYSGITMVGNPYSGVVALPCGANGWNTSSWPVTLVSGAATEEILIPTTQIPSEAGIKGKVVQSGSWINVDHSGSDIPFADFTGFNPDTQIISIVDDGSVITIAPAAK